MRKVITYGTYDLLHYGHVKLLQRAKALGDYLIVALSTDEFNWNEKQKKCYFSYEERKSWKIIVKLFIFQERLRFLQHRSKRIWGNDRRIKSNEDETKVKKKMEKISSQIF